MRIYGIDVSHHQGTIDWETAASELRRVNGGENAGFAMIRAGYSDRSGNGGLTEDRQARRNLAECNRLGIPCGVYVYCYDHSPAAARRTMDDCLVLIKNYRLEYPVAYDVEYEPFHLSCGKAMNTAIIRAAMETVEAGGYYGMIYASRDFFKRYTDLAQLSRYDKWEAAYTASDDGTVDNGIWQFSSRNALGIAGFGASLDCDAAYRDYPAIIQKAGLNRATRELWRVHTAPMSKGDLPRYLAAMEQLKQELGIDYQQEKVG